MFFFAFYQSGPTQGETLFVVEALLNCSSKSIKAADGDTPLPCGPDEKGEMQVRFTTEHTRTVVIDWHYKKVTKKLVRIINFA